MSRERSKVVDMYVNNFFDIIRTRSNHTKDIKDLKCDYGNIIPLFVFDNLMKGRSDDHVLNECYYYGPATTQEDSWALMLNPDGNGLMFPQSNQMFRTDHNLNPMFFKRVQGDLYGVPLDVIYYLDTKLSNGSLYDRCEIPITLHLKSDSFAYIKHAIVYLPQYKSFQNVKMNLGHQIKSDFLKHGMMSYHAYKDPYIKFEKSEMMNHHDWADFEGNAPFY